MRVLGAFVAGVGIAAILLALEFLAEGFAAGLQFSAGVFLGFTALNLVVGFSATLVGGVPIWLILRSRHVRSPWAHASVGYIPSDCGCNDCWSRWCNRILVHRY
jgi:hypothetical protein